MSGLSATQDTQPISGTLTANAGTGTLAVFFSPANPAVAATFSGSTAAYFSPSNPNVIANAGTGSFNVQLDPGHTLGSISNTGFNVNNAPTITGITNTIAVDNVTATGGQTMDENYKAQRIMLVASSTNSSMVVNAGSGTFTVQFDPGHELGTIRGNSSTLTVFLPDTGHELGSIRGIANTIAVDNVTATGGQTMDENYKAQRIMLVASSTNSSLVVNAGTGSFTVQFDPGHELGIIRGNTNTLTVFFPDTGHELGTIRGNTNTLTVFLPDTGHTLGKVDAGLGTFNVQLDPGHLIGSVNNAQWIGSTAPTVGSKTSANSLPVVIASDQGTVTVRLDPGSTLGKVDQGVGGTSSWVMKDLNATSTAPTFVAGSASGVSLSGNTVISPIVGKVRKIFAYNLSTTGLSAITAKFTNGAGTAPTLFAEIGLSTTLATDAKGMAYAQMAVPPPGYLFATASGSTLALLLDTASKVHYSVYYFNESA